MYVRVVVEMKCSTSFFKSKSLSELGAKIQVAAATDASMHRWRRIQLCQVQSWQCRTATAQASHLALSIELLL